MVALEHELSEELGMRVEIATRGQAGAVRVHYRSLDQLDAFLARLRSASASRSF
jgi:ParB family chromosome partitioning protein